MTIKLTHGTHEADAYIADTDYFLYSVKVNGKEITETRLYPNGDEVEIVFPNKTTTIWDYIAE